MTFFVDANVVLYSASVSAYRDPCREVLAAIVGGHAAGQTSTAALEEVWHLESSGRVADIVGLTQAGYQVLAPLLPVTDDVFRLALELDATALGTNDRLHAATCAANDIEVILSADADFDDVPGLRRVDPLDRHAVEALVGS